ncbi:MAG TPA: hypothetical protein DCE42_20505 [Myxococcales bacterium]|nr:hypothetical protein [Myxococcales bacterium]
MRIQQLASCFVLIGLCLFAHPTLSEARKPIKRQQIDCQRLHQLWNIARYREFTRGDLRGLDWMHLELLRNGIYAKHYMPFGHMRHRNFFMNKRYFPGYKSWRTWNKHMINRMERSNVELIKKRERALDAFSKRWRRLRKYRLRYKCGKRVLVSKKTNNDDDPKWDRWKPTPYPVVAHCGELESQMSALSKRPVKRKDLRVLRRKGWLHLTLLRNGLYAKLGHRFKTPWMSRFYRTFKWYRPKRTPQRSRVVLQNAYTLMQLEKRIGSMRLSFKDYNLQVRCAGSKHHKRLTLRQRVVLLALSFLGTARFSYKKRVKALKKRFGKRGEVQKVYSRYDCSGLIESVFQGLNIDLAKPAPRRYARYWNTNGVKIILYNLKHNFASKCTRRKPKLGDIVFFDKCWDANNNGTSNDDPLTHIGIVSGIYPDGTVEFVHNAGSGMRRRIEIGRLNLKKPYSKKHNKPTPMCGGRVPARVFNCYSFPKTAEQLHAKVRRKYIIEQSRKLRQMRAKKQRKRRRVARVTRQKLRKRRIVSRRRRLRRRRKRRQRRRKQKLRQRRKKRRSRRTL